MTEAELRAAAARGENTPVSVLGWMRLTARAMALIGLIMTIAPLLAPAVGAGLLVLSLNTRMMGIVSRLRVFHKERHQAVKSGQVDPAPGESTIDAALHAGVLQASEAQSLHAA